MGKIVCNGNSVKAAQYLKAPMNALKGMQALRSTFRRNTHDMCRGKGGQRVQNIVAARDSQGNLAKCFAAVADSEAFTGLWRVGNPGWIIIVAALKAKSDNLFPGNACHRLFYIVVIAIHQQYAGGLQGELVEGLDNTVKGSEVVQVVLFNIGNYGKIGVKVQKSIYVIAGLADNEVRVPCAPVAVNQRQPSADDGAGVLSSFE